ncbi:ArsR/SmtB family transcription factor [Oscillospiraceae bacterium LTW-04]|nr:metalloregulator ArsR/SmtB family transcription factor [Oscillospiraceae bacterium MB24-C1]
MACINTHDPTVVAIPTDRELDLLTQIFSIFADSTRIRIICALQDDELSVNEICAALEMSQPAISHQLRILKNARVVKCRRAGRSSFYSLDDSHVALILKMGLEHVREI